MTTDTPTEPAASPWRLAPSTWPGTLKRTAMEFLDDQLLQWAGALTFFAMLSLFPALLALVATLGLLGTAATEPLVENVGRLAPGAARDITLDALRAVRASQSSAGPTFVIALVIALWSASAYVGAFIPAANVVWEAPEERPFLRKLAVRIALTLTLLLLIAITALTVVLTGPIAEQIGALVGLGAVAVEAWQYAKWPFLAVAVMTLLTLLYWASPNVRHPGWSWLTPGSVLAVGLWIAASLAFTFYVNNLSNYNDVYGTIGGVLVFLLWLWLTNIAILLGAELNAEIERTRAIEAGMRPEDKTPYLPLRNG